MRVPLPFTVFYTVWLFLLDWWVVFALVTAFAGGVWVGATL